MAAGDESTSAPTSTVSPGVRVVVTAVDDADFEAAISAIRRQAYDHVVDVTAIGAPSEIDGVIAMDSLDEAIATSDSSVDYLWIIHSDARPRPDSLAALVREVERPEAGLGASKLLRAGSKDELEAIGSATDVFGEPFSGLDDGEVDQQQYDVVREVSYVQPVSMLVRRDLARGLGSLDPLLPPSASGLDFSQRARLAGGRVIIVPSSEVYHQGKCGLTVQGWRERAGRMRAMLKSYSLLSLAWVLPLALIVNLVDALLNLLLARWRPLVSFLAASGWNLLHLPSTLASRRRANLIRSVGDEELFRFQTAGSVRLRSIGAEVTAKAMQLFDDDQILTRGARRMWSSSGSFGAFIAVLVVVISARGIFFSGVPNMGLSFPFEPPTGALRRIVGGWNESGLGSPTPVHPVTVFTGIISLAWFGAEGAARTLLTIGFGVIAIIGMGRLLGRLGMRGSGRYLAGLVLIAGPGTAALVGRGSWTALGAAALLPWAIRAVFVHPADKEPRRWGLVGWALVLGWSVAALSPLLVLIPVIAVLLWSLQGGKRGRLLLSAATLVGGVVAVNFLNGDPGWLTDSGRRLGIEVNFVWAAALLLAVVPLFNEASRPRRVGNFGAILGLGGLLVWTAGYGGPGLEEAALVTASLGSAIVVGVALDKVVFRPLPLVSALGALVILGWSVVSIFGGHLGLPSGDTNDDLVFAESLADDGQARRVLYVSSVQALVPGESRPGPGYWYRLLDGSGTTNDKVWLPRPRAGDQLLDDRLTAITTGSNLRPGTLLNEFSIGWVVVDGPETDLDLALANQFDIIPVPLDSEVRIYENPTAVPVASSESGDVWTKVGVRYSGDPGSDRVAITTNFSPSWGPDGDADSWWTTVSASTGTAAYSGHTLNMILGYGSILVLLGGLALMVVGRRKS